MDISAIMALIVKGLGVVSTAIAVGKEAGPAIQAIEDLVTSTQAGTVTQDQIDETESSLDAMIVDFNTPIPPATA